MRSSTELDGQAAEVDKDCDYRGKWGQGTLGEIVFSGGEGEEYDFFGASPL